MITLEETDIRFYIDSSALPNAGKGLFAKEKIIRGDILEIIGVYIKQFGKSDECTEYAKNRKYVYKDYLIIPVGYASMINYAPDQEKENVNLIQTDRSYLEFTKDVEPDDEILLYNGDNMAEYYARVHQDDTAQTIDKEFDNFLIKDYYNLSFLRDQ